MAGSIRPAYSAAGQHLLEGELQARGLVQGLLVLARGVGVGHDPAPGVERHPARGHHRGPDEDVGVEAAGRRDVEERPGVDPARRRLHAVEDLHAADLRHPGDGAAGEERPQRVQGVEAVAQRGLHVGDDVADVGLLLDRHQLVHADGPDGGHAPEVVPRQVHQHQVLRALLLAEAQLVGEAAVAVRVAVVGTRSGQRARDRRPALHGEEPLRRRAHDLEAARAHVPREGRRADAPQRGVEGQPARRPGQLEALGEVGLVDVPGRDVLLDDAHQPRMLRARHVRPLLEVERRRGFGAPVTRGQAEGGVGPRRGRAGGVVGRDAVVVLDEEAVHGQGDQARRGRSRSRPRGVVGQHPRHPALGRPPAGAHLAQQGAQRGKGVPGDGPRSLGGGNHEAGPGGDEDGARAPREQVPPRQRRARGRALQQHAGAPRLAHRLVGPAHHRAVID